MPDALISRITSLGPGVGSGNSLSSSFRSPRNTTPFMVSSRAWVSAALERARAGHDDLGPVGLLAVHLDLGPRLGALGPTAGDDPAGGEGLVRPEHVRELHVEPSAQVEPAAEMPRHELGDARERHAAPDHRVPEAELSRRGLVVVVVAAPVEEVVAHRLSERLVELHRQRLAGGLDACSGAFLARGIPERDVAAGLLRQKALVMDAARDELSGLVAHPHLLRDHVAIAPAV